MKMRNTLKGYMGQNKILITLILLLCLGFLLLSYITDSLGLGLYGFCQLDMKKGFSYAHLGLCIIYFLFCNYTVNYVR